MSVKMMTKKQLSVAVGLLIAGSGSPAVTQAQPQLEEILVTSQKREQSSQDIPVSVTALSGDTLENMGVQSFDDLTKVSPSLTITQGDQANNTPISLRGIGTFAFGIGIEPSVLVMIDEVPVAAQAQSFQNLVDIERIEVLRGPQSTLFGKSASAGVISITTKDPSLEPEATVKVSFTDDDETRVLGSASGMLSDTVGVRVNGYYTDYDGHITNLETGNDLNGKESHGVRTKLRWDASDRLVLKFIGEYNDSEDNCCQAPFTEVSPDALGLGQIPQDEWLPGLTPSRENTKVRINTEPKNTSEDWATTLKADYELGQHTLTSISAFRNWEFTFLQDIDATNAFTLDQSSAFETDFFMQEFRLTSPVGDKFDYVAGLYYENRQTDRSFERGPVFVANWDATSDNQILAVFAQSNYRITNKINLITGLRFQNEEIDATFQRPDEAKITGSDDDGVALGNVSLQYFTDSDIMFFGKYSRGYKGKGFDITSSFDQRAADNPVDPETSDSFELGMKGTFFNRRLQLNATLFTTAYDDFQAQSTVSSADDQTFEFRLNNVGKLKTSGLELDATAMVTDNLQVDFGLAYIDAEIDEFKNADCFDLQTEAQGCIDGKQDLSGEDLNNSPDLKLTVGANYDLRLDNMPFDGFVNASYQWQDDVHFSLLNDPNLTQGSYGVLNMSAGIIGNDDAYKVTLFVNNLTSKSYITNAANSQALFGGESVFTHQIPRSAQRYAGIRLKYNF